MLRAHKVELGILSMETVANLVWIVNIAAQQKNSFQDQGNNSPKLVLHHLWRGVLSECWNVLYLGRMFNQVTPWALQTVPNQACIMRLSWTDTRNHVYNFSVNDKRKLTGANYDFVLDGKSCRKGWITAQTPVVLTYTNETFITTLLCAFNLTPFPCGRWSRANDKVK